MTSTQSYLFSIVITLTLGLCACGTTGTPTPSPNSSQLSFVTDASVKKSMGKGELVSILRVPVISVTELTKPMTTQSQNCVSKADHSEPIANGASSNSQQCINSSSNEKVKLFRVLYELSGRQYAVDLPENPGPHIQLHLTSHSSQNSLSSDGVPIEGTKPTIAIDQPDALTSATTYPYVYYSGFIYRPVPIFISSRYRIGGGHRIGRGRKH